jgi:hypothetical protein
MTWPFDQGPRVAAFTTVGVLEQDLPVLEVVHFADDHSWAFLCGTTNAVEDGRVVAMATALRLDPTLESVADLPPGWTARRTHVGGEWTREREGET